MSLYMHVYFISLFMQKGKKEFGEFMHVYFISSFMQKGEKEFGEFMHVCVVWLMHFIECLYVYYYA